MAGPKGPKPTAAQIEDEKKKVLAARRRRARELAREQANS